MSAISGEIPLNEGLVARVVNEQRGALFPWVPVFLAIGIGIYFLLRFEPSPTQYTALALTCVALVGLVRVASPDLRPLLWAGTLVLLGVLLAGARAHLVAGPVLDFRYYGAIEGRIIAIDRSHSDKPRLTLDNVVLERMDPARIPERVRVSLHGSIHFDPQPGLRIMMTGHLAPPQGPVEPGGFDFRRMAWFQSLGAVGYSRTPAVVAAPQRVNSLALRITQMRLRISAHVQQALPGRTGAFAAAVTTGDRAAMDKDTLQALRDTNLAHLLAISGLHMGLLTGFVFSALRLLIAAIPWFALRAPGKKVAAIGAIAAGAYYYALSGGNVATERAFIMVAVMFAGVLVDRRAITLCAVAIAAILVLLMRPEALVSPGFQMSFAATTALVAVFTALRDWDGPTLPRYLGPVMAVVISSTVAGLATAPVAAAHFNRIADYGLIANLVSVPMMGLVVMPGAVLAAVLAPLGLEQIGLQLMAPGIDWILGVAHTIADVPGAVTPIVSPPSTVLPLIALGGLFVILWQGRAHWLGLAPICLAFALWQQAERPPLLISQSGKLMGALTVDGRALSKPKGDGFTANSWLENDGDRAEQADAAARPGIDTSGAMAWVDLDDRRITLVRGRGAEKSLPQACDTSDIVIFTSTLKSVAPCPLFDISTFRRRGALAISIQDGALVVTGANDATDSRLWHRHD